MLRALNIQIKHYSNIISNIILELVTEYKSTPGEENK